MDNIINFEQAKNHAKEIIYFNDERIAPKNESHLYIIIRNVFIVCIIAILVLSLLFRESLFSEMSISTGLCIFIIAGFLIKKGGYKKIECPSQLQFFDDYLVFYVPKHYIKKGRERMEIQKIYYKDVTKCDYRTNARRLVIYGMMEFTFYDYDKQGKIGNHPSLQRHADSILSFYTVFDNEHDFKKIIEENSPLKVTCVDM